MPPTSSPAAMNRSQHWSPATVTVPPRPIDRLLNATLADGRVVDVGLAGDTVASVSPATGATASAADLDLSGYLLLTAGCDAHAHLDKALTWETINPPMGDLRLAIESFNAHQELFTVENTLERARRAALGLLANGTTAVRSHVNITVGAQPLRGAMALVQLKDELAELMDIELVALANEDIPDAVIEQAIDLGIDLVGGVPHLASDPLAEVDRLVALAGRLGVGIDLHSDETLDGDPTLGHFARAVRAWPIGQHASAGHCVRLGTLPETERDQIIDEVVASDVGIITLPITNLYLQGWQHPVATPRGLTALRALIDAGARLGAGADNVRDPFNPLGRSDALETAMLLVTAGHLTADEAWHLSSAGSRAVMRLPEAGASVGARADFLIIRAGSLLEAIAEASADRMVIHAGRLVSQTTVTRTTATPSALARQGR